MMIKEIFQPSRELSNSYIDMDTKNLPLNDFPDEIPVSISFVESISGGEKEVYVPVKIKCQKCKHNGNYGDKLFEVCKYCNGVGFKSFPSTPGTEEVKIACKFCKGAQYSYKVRIYSIFFLRILLIEFKK